MTPKYFLLPLAAFISIISAFSALAKEESEGILPPSTFLNPLEQGQLSTPAGMGEEAENNPIDWNKPVVSRDLGGRSVLLDNTSWDKQYRDGQNAYFFGLYQQAYNLWLPLARAGYADAQASLGWLFQSGLNGNKDLQQALHWYQLAVAQHHPVAENNLGVFYEQGIEVVADRQKAMKLYRQSAQQKYRFAQYNLGVLLSKGDDNERREAMQWLRAAAAQGVEKAMTQLTNLSESN